MSASRTNGPVNGVEDVLPNWCTDQFLMATLVYLDPSGQLMGSQEDVLSIVRARRDELDNELCAMDSNQSIENMVADALGTVFADRLALDDW